MFTVLETLFSLVIDEIEDLRDPGRPIFEWVHTTVNKTQNDLTSVNRKREEGRILFDGLEDDFTRVYLKDFTNHDLTEVCNKEKLPDFYFWIRCLVNDVDSLRVTTCKIKQDSSKIRRI